MRVVWNIFFWVYLWGPNTSSEGIWIVLQAEILEDTIFHECNNDNAV